MRGSGNSLARAPAVQAVRRKLRTRALALRGLATDLAAGDRRLAGFETWPTWLFYAPVAGCVIWHGLRRGGISLPAAANPPANADGVLNVSKSGIFGAMRPAGRRWIPDYISTERRPGEPVDEATADLISRMNAAGHAFPVVAKPDRGGGGTGVRLVRNERELRDYVAAFPVGPKFLLQAFVPFEHEAGVMYVRYPGERTGRVVSLALKEAPVVIGDGTTTLRALIEHHPRARHHREHAFREHRSALERVPERGERVELIFARNHCRGAVFQDATHLLTPALERRIDEIARSIPSFHVGRLDIRYASVAELQEGRSFRAIEVNGVASEPIHAWDPANDIGRAWRIYFEQIERIYQLGAANRAIGYRRPGIFLLLAGWWRQKRVMRSYPGRD